MERFDVRRGIIKEVGENGGLSELAKEFFEKVEGLLQNPLRFPRGYDLDNWKI